MRCPHAEAAAPTPWQARTCDWCRFLAILIGVEHVTVTSREVAGGKLEYTFLFRTDELGPQGERPLVYSAFQMHRTAVLDRLAKFTYEDLERTPGEELIDVGTLISTKLISQEIRERMGRLAGPFLHIEVDEEAAKIPWELTFLGGDFVGSKMAVGRTILTQGKTPPPRPPAPAGPQPFLMLLVGNPAPVPDHEPLPDAVKELSHIKEIASGLGGPSMRAPVVLLNEEACLMKLEQALEQGARYQVFHFAGHCDFSEEDADGTGLVFPEGILSPGNLPQLFGGLPPRLIFTNACESAKGRKTPSTDVRKRLTLPQGFIEAGVEAFIGCLWRVEDDAVGQIAHEFYSRALAGVPIGLALREAKAKVHSPYMSRCAYIVYGDPSMVLSGPRPDFVMIRLMPHERVLKLRKLSGVGLALERTNGERFLLPAKAKVTFGRKRPQMGQEGADVVLRLATDEETVHLGRVHLELHDADAGFYVVDRSHTGTLINGHRIKAGERLAVPLGSTLGLVAMNPGGGPGTALLEIQIPMPGEATPSLGEASMMGEFRTILPD